MSLMSQNHKKKIKIALQTCTATFKIVAVIFNIVRQKLHPVIWILDAVFLLSYLSQACLCSGLKGWQLGAYFGWLSRTLANWTRW